MELDGRLRRKAAGYTIGLWIAGFTWLTIILAALGRLYGGVGMAAQAPYFAATILLALGLEELILRTQHWRSVKRHVAIAGYAIGAALLSGLIDTQWTAWIARNYIPAARSWSAGTVASWLRASFLYSWVYCLNVSIVLLLVATHGAQQQARQLAKANHAAQTARLTMLRYQLNPHFLFNSLNAISSLVLTRQNERAEIMIDRLAAFLRSSNSSDPSSLVPLGEELATTEEYLEVERVRFGDRMLVAFEVPAGLDDILVPSFLLQPIVENSVKYAVAPSQDPVTIRIEAREAAGRLTLAVRDDGAPGSTPTGGTGVGLENVRARLRAFFGDQAEYRGGPAEPGYLVTIAMPARRRGFPAR